MGKCLGVSLGELLDERLKSSIRLCVTDAGFEPDPDIVIEYLVLSHLQRQVDIAVSPGKAGSCHADDGVVLRTSWMVFPSTLGSELKCRCQNL